MFLDPSVLAYLHIGVSFIISILLALVIYFLSYGLATQRGDSEKVSSYECGFDPFEDSRVQFDVHFYLVAILFIVFDREAAFVYPWAMTLTHLGPIGFFSMLDFLLELLIGYLYVWALGALEV
jgi:NADH-quinone oxidoreductase subunit A